MLVDGDSGTVVADSGKAAVELAGPDREQTEIDRDGRLDESLAQLSTGSVPSETRERSRMAPASA